MNIYNIPYTGNLKWIQNNTILFVRHGSNAYGTNIASSDVDYKGIVIPPKEYFFGVNNKFEQAESKDPDMVIFDIRKFFNLAMNANPNVLEILFVDPEDKLLVTEFGQELINNRDKFLSKKIRYTLAGYAHSQLKRIKTHKKWLLNPVLNPPTRKEFDLLEKPIIPKDQLEAAQSQISKKVEDWNLDFVDNLDEAQKIELNIKINEILTEIRITKDDLWVHAAKYLGYNDNFIYILQKEKEYESKKREHEQYNIWKNNRNPARAILEEKYKIDTKHAAHLVRLYRICEEVLSIGKYLVKRPDREELIFIRNGGWSYEEIIDWADKQEKKVDELYKKSTLPNSPNRIELDNLCIDLIERHLYKNG